MHNLTIKVPIDISCGTYEGTVSGWTFNLPYKTIPLPEGFRGVDIPAILKVEAGGIGYLTFI